MIARREKLSDLYSPALPYEVKRDGRRVILTLTRFIKRLVSVKVTPGVMPLLEPSLRGMREKDCC